MDASGFELSIDIDDLYLCLFTRLLGTYSPNWDFPVNSDYENSFLKSSVDSFAHYRIDPD